MSDGRIDPGLVAERLAGIRDRIRVAGGDPAAVAVVAVTKGFGPEAVEAAWAAGIVDIGENYANELLAKRAALEGRGPGEQRWHYLGALQTNKLARLVPVVDCFQSVSREREGMRLATLAPHVGVLVQVGFSENRGRPGCPPEEVAALVGALGRLGVEVGGLMAVAPPGGAAARAAFATLRTLADDLGLPVRSMGMTEDLELAVAHGSTMVRVGRGLFGDRTPVRLSAGG